MRRNRNKIRQQNAKAEREHRRRWLRPCADCGYEHRADEECDIDWDEEGLGLGAFIGSLLAGLSAFVERQRQRHKQQPLERPALPQLVDDDVIDVEYEVIEDDKNKT